MTNSLDDIEFLKEICRTMNRTIRLQYENDALNKKLNALLNYLNLEIHGGNVILTELHDLQEITPIKIIQIQKCEKCNQKVNNDE